MSTWWSHFAVRQPDDCKNSDPTLSFFLPSLDYFLLLLLSSILLSEDFISEYMCNNSFSYLVSPFSVTLLRISPLYLSSANFISRCINNKNSFSSFSSCSIQSWQRQDRGDCRALLISVHRAFKRGHCSFSGTHTISDPAAVASFPLALLIFSKTSRLPRRYSSSYSLFRPRIAVLLFLFRS